MPPLWKRSPDTGLKVDKSTSTSLPQPSTWKVACALTGTAWLSYLIYENAQYIWNWIQKKIELRNQRKNQQTQQRLGRRSIASASKKLRKRGAPFHFTVNIVYWISRVVRWIYHQTDMIPQRIQNRVNREHTAIQDAEWELKNDEADEKVKVLLAKEFPKYYKKKYLDPYEEGSELYDENKSIFEGLRHSHGVNGTSREWSKEKILEPRAVW